MKIRLLQIEDSESDAALNIRTLEKAGYEVDFQIISTGVEMEEALAKNVFDLILSDHNLPQFDSPSALKIFKEKGLDIPFIVVSGAIGEETAVMLMKSGAQDYVMKGNLARLAPVVERELYDAEMRRQHKQSEEKLRISEERFRQVAETAGEMIWEVDKQMLYRYVSPIVEVLTGYSNEEMVGRKYLFDLVPPEDRSDYTSRMREYFLNKQTITDFSSRRVCKDGRVIILETSAIPALDSTGNLLGYRGTDMDVTRRKQLEATLRELYHKEKQHNQKLQEEAEVKNLFINVLAHELRNPLTAVVVSSDILQDMDGLSDEIKEKLVKNINDSAKLLTNRLDELLDLARYSKGTFDLKRRVINAQDFLHEIIERFKPNLEKRSQELVVNISPELTTMNVDTSRMEQVITNLLSNASKYSPENSTITMRAGMKDKGFYFEIVDQGIGISTDDQSKIFQPYYRSSKNKNVPGIGLGLAISNKIVEAHGGKITLASMAGKGSTFSVLIPNNN
ncbi:MAG: PAS domain S-box protein [Dehalococcoidales bacterium]|nr:PAS domain S-box protein [Dehalococcoidales bacterium]